MDQIHPTLVGKQVAEAILFAVQFSGQTINHTDLKVQTKFLTDELIEKFPEMKILDLKKCFSRGIQLEYGEYYGLNTQTFTRWIIAFLKIAKGFTHRFTASSPHPEPNPLTKEQREEIFQKALTRCRDDFEKTGIIYDLGNSVFEGLYRRKLILLTPEQISEYKGQALKNEVARIEERLRIFKVLTRAEHYERKDMEMELHNLSSPENRQVKYEAKLLALTDYFKRLSVGG